MLLIEVGVDTRNVNVPLWNEKKKRPPDHLGINFGLKVGDPIHAYHVHLADQATFLNLTSGTAPAI